MNKTTAIIWLTIVVVACILAFGISMDKLDFAKGQGGTAWLALFVGAGATVLTLVKVHDFWLKVVLAIAPLVPGAVALITFWSK